MKSDFEGDVAAHTDKEGGVGCDDSVDNGDATGGDHYDSMVKLTLMLMPLLQTRTTRCLVADMVVWW